MNRRRCKKLRLGAFRQCGFEVRFGIQPGHMDEVIGALVRMLEESALGCGGSGTEVFEGYITAWDRSATEADRTLVHNWLTGCNLVTNPVVEPLSDAWWPDGYRRHPKLLSDTWRPG